MWWPFKKVDRPIEPEMLEVGKVSILIEMDDNSTLTREFYGYEHSMRWIDGSPIVTTGKQAFNAWLERCGETGFLSLGEGRFIPREHVKEVTATYGTHAIKLEDG